MPIRHGLDLTQRTRTEDKNQFQYYDDTTLWWIIAQANHLGKGTLSISEPQRIRIPTELESILKSFEDLQRSR